MLLEGEKIHPLVAVLSWLSLINLMLAVFNLIPGFPLDGGRVFRSAVWGATGNAGKSTRIAAGLGRLVAFFFIFLGIYLLAKGLYVNGVWMAFIGWFLLQASTKSLRAQNFKDVLSGHYASEAMLKDMQFISPETTITDLVYTYVMPSGRRYFPVMSDGRVSGIVTVDILRSVPKQQWQFVKIENIMVPATSFISVTPLTPLMDVMKIMSDNGTSLAPVVEDGSFLGMVTKETMMEFIKTKSDLGLN